MRTARGASRARNALIGVATAVLIAAGATACSDTDQTPESLASKASEAVASATARLSDIQGGFNAKGDVKAGATENKDGRAVSEITATNSSGGSADYTIQVNFKDADGNLLDAAVVTINDVPAGGSKTGEARSNRDLSGAPEAEIARAVRH
ncbi:FxLYD domain-containing protein [Streptomyces sp. NPDC002133]|uniref:FxLYD domain-containing protein n=1 Tax=Streptomyces sp. NPDC002133 TaxID=3154409 RepID=UPI003317ECD4